MDIVSKFKPNSKYSEESKQFNCHFNTSIGKSNLNDESGDYEYEYETVLNDDQKSSI